MDWVAKTIHEIKEREDIVEVVRDYAHIFHMNLAIARLSEEEREAKSRTACAQIMKNYPRFAGDILQAWGASIHRFHTVYDPENDTKI